ncbi:MAG: TonB-dependent receptor, partial [Cytophagaceae bacterium]|nr:TonB-dependent receptor [Gemmatimonadaceae bacterium]
MRDRHLRPSRLHARGRVLLFVVAWLLPVAFASAQPTSSGGAIAGRVVDESGAPVARARVLLLGLARAVLTRDDGTWAHLRLSPGRYLVQVLRLGYEASRVDTVQVGQDVVQRTYTLRPSQLRLSQVVVTPGSYAVLDQQAPSQQVLTRDELLTRPQLAEDLFRTLNRLPGISGSDFSAQLRMRNSHPDELLVMLDGMELIEPFHMKDFDGAVTILDQDAVGGVELNTGGFGVAYGNRSGGLVLLSSAVPTEGRTRTAVGLSLSNLRLRTEGTFADRKGAWLVSARRGYLDIVFKLLNEDEAPNPTYYDVLGKVRYQLGTRHVVTANALVAQDVLTFEVDEGHTTASGRYGNNYLWATVATQWHSRLRSTTLAARSDLGWRRDGQEAEFFGNQPFVRAGFRDRRTLDAWSLKQDWTWDPTARVSLTFGGEGRREAADYDYTRFAVNRARVGQSVVVRDSSALGVSRDVSGSRLGG